MFIQTEDIIKLLLALFLGGMVGVERELRDKAAGFRTLMFISTGSALFTILSARFAPGLGLTGDPARIAAQIVSGIGFLGAGVILRENGEIRGLTTAATVWMVAALGMGVGAGQYLFSVLATALILLALWVFPSLERMMNNFSQIHSYQVTAPASQEQFKTLTHLFLDHDLTIMAKKLERRGDTMICQWTVSGRPSNHAAVTESLFDNEDIIEFKM